MVGVLYNVHISDLSSPHSPPPGACHSHLLSGLSQETHLQLVSFTCPCPLTPNINTDCERDSFSYKLVHVTPVLKLNSCHSEKPVAYKVFCHLTTASLPSTHIHTSEMLLPATSHSLCSGPLPPCSTLNMLITLCLRYLLKCLNLHRVYVLTRIC